MPDRADDGFARYYAEKLWELIPAFYRDEDALAQPPGVLRGLVEAIASQAAVLRRSHDRLWEDQFIDLCDDWAVPYLGDLLGTRLVSALNRRGRRVDVAKTIYYRRRKGTPRVVEELISDIAGWEGTAVESFRRLGRTRHLLDPRPAPLAAPLTGTLPGGWADLRRPHGAARAGGPFDEFAHSADLRRHRGYDGRYNLPKLGLHLYRLVVYPLRGVTPRARAAGPGFTFDPSGRDVPLFAPRARQEDFDYDAWRAAREWELPAPIPCRLLGHAEFVIGEGLIAALRAGGLPAAAAAELQTLRGQRIRDEPRLRATLRAMSNGPALLAGGVYEAILAGATVPDCGKRALLPPALGPARRVAVAVEEAPGTVVPHERTAAGNLAAWTASAPPHVRLVIDPERGRLLFVGSAPAAGSRVLYHTGAPGEVGAGAYDRPGAEEGAPARVLTGGGAIPAASQEAAAITQIADSATYGPVADKSGISAMTMRAANGQRPYLRLASNWSLNTGANADAALTLDGLWAGGSPVLLRGDYALVTLRSVTLDPGGVDADGAAIGPSPLLVEAHVRELLIERSIVAAVRVQNGGVVERLRVVDSIVHPADSPGLALDLGLAELELTRSTVLGSIDVNRLQASEALVTGNVDVADTQSGCFRFSAAPTGSRLPRPYEAFLFAPGDEGAYFVSQRFGDPGYAQLSAAAPVQLQRGAESGSEIGVYSALNGPIRLDSLRAKVDEFLPFGLIPFYAFEA